LRDAKKGFERHKKDFDRPQFRDKTIYFENRKVDAYIPGPEVCGFTSFYENRKKGQ